MSQAPMPISEYVLFVHDPVDEEVTNDPQTGRLSLGAFHRAAKFISSSSPFPTPNVGDEIELAFVDAEEPTRSTGPRIKRIVTRVSHRVEVKSDRLCCVMNVHTRRG